jgi:hypothetical protein
MVTNNWLNDWLYVCDDCGKEWSMEHEAHAQEHERKLRHAVYQRHRAAHARWKGEQSVRPRSLPSGRR